MDAVGLMTFAGIAISNAVRYIEGRLSREGV